MVRRGVQQQRQTERERAQPAEYFIFHRPCPPEKSQRW